MPSPVVEIVDEIFSQLSPEDEKRLISLPYRVGLYVSFADVTGGWDAQESELQSLTGILREFSQDFYKSEFTQKVLLDCLNQRSQWPGWSHSIENVPGEVSAMIQTLVPMLEAETIRSFKDVLVDIALVVAMAFREEDKKDDLPQTATPSKIVRDILGKLVGTREEADPLEHMNISVNERAALDRLLSAVDNIA